MRPDRPRPRPIDNLAAAKAILDRDVEDLGDFDLAEVTARATVALADAVERIANAMGPPAPMGRADVAYNNTRTRE